MALDGIRRQVYDYKDRIIFENRNVTIDTLKEKWIGVDRNRWTLLEGFRLSILDLEKLVFKGQYRRKGE